MFFLPLNFLVFPFIEGSSRHVSICIGFLRLPQTRPGSFIRHVTPPGPLPAPSWTHPYPIRALSSLIIRSLRCCCSATRTDTCRHIRYKLHATAQFEWPSSFVGSKCSLILSWNSLSQNVFATPVGTSPRTSVFVWNACCQEKHTDRACNEENIGRTREDATGEGETYITSSSINCTRHQILQGL
jgi:hypothetical protein